MLLGAPLSKGQAIDNSLSSQCYNLERATSSIGLTTAHDALVLLRASFSAPKLQHIMRASPCYDNEHLLKFDELLRAAIFKICNVSLFDYQWLQASLPVKSGGLGIRRVSSLVSPAFLASAVGTRDLQNQILHADMIMLDSALDIYAKRCGKHATINSMFSFHLRNNRLGINPCIVERELAELTEHQISNYDKARLLASTSKHSGDWLYVIPISSCGLHLDEEVIRIAVGLRLGVDICEPHSCVCGELVDVRGFIALSCKRNNGRFIRHNSLNGIFHLSLNRAGIPATKEPQSLS